MLASLSRVLAVAGLAASALATSTLCVVEDLHAVQKKTELLNCLVNDFEHRGGSCLTPCHDLKPLGHIYLADCELDALLETAIEDVQTSCDFSDQDSQTVLLALAQIQEPLTNTLNAFSNKACDFTDALGPHLTHKLVASSLRHTRYLTLNLLRSVYFRVEPQYRPVIQTTAEGINEQFIAVIRKFYATF